MSCRIRFIFVIVCIIITIYLGFDRLVQLLDDQQGYEDYQLAINEVMVSNRSSLRDEEGDFEGWTEIYNKGETSINLHGFGLSDDNKQPFLWTFPDVIMEPRSFCIVWTSGKNKNTSDAPLHANFKLNKDKVIILTAPNSNWNDIFILQSMGDNISYGRKPDGSSELYGFDEGTPGRSNSIESLIEGPSTARLEEPIFSHNGGFYSQAFNLILKTNDTEAKIYYTLDGSIPTKGSSHYTRPILIPSTINKGTVVRARTYKDGYPKSEIVTQSYFVEKNIYDKYNVPIISLVTDPENLFDYKNGIYVAGKIFDQWKRNHPGSEINGMTPANYNQRGKKWEREASIELFKPDGTVGLVQNIGIRVFGGYSRADNLKPLSLFARSDYDDKEIFSYDFFDGNAKKKISNGEINKFSKILLRTSSTDSKYALFRDALIQSLIEPLGILDTQSSKPCLVYINGVYYGIHNIREAYDKSYIYNHYDVAIEDVVIIKNPTGTAGIEIQEGYVGDEMHYNQIISYIKENGANSNNDYNFVKRHMDIDNFIEYNVLQIYCDNRDWPGNNVQIWRKRAQEYNPEAPYGQDGRWRWMVFDLDYGFGLYTGEIAATNNSLKRATEENGPAWPNPPWSTLLLRSLFHNNEFKIQFINTFADRLNTIFFPDVVVNRIEDMEKIYYPNIMDHIKRWNLHDNNIENWKNEIEALKRFAIKRPENMRQHIVDHFNLAGTAIIQIEKNEGGIVRINSLELDDTDIPWQGVYFKDIPITVEAKTKPGFIFVGWKGISESKNRTIKVNLSHSSYLKAVFSKKQ